MRLYEMNKNRTMSIKNQKGLSLLELMISMLIGLFLLAGVVTNFISTTNADIKREAVSEMDANASEAFRFLRRAISHAGYRSIENIRLEDDMAFHISTTDVANVACDGTTDRDASDVTADLRTRDNGALGDRISVISLTDNSANAGALVSLDCTDSGATRSVVCSTDPNSGMADPVDAKIYNSFWLDSSTKTLNCRGSRNADITKESLVDGVETIQYLYGVKSDLGSLTFRNATDVTNANQWPSVVSVQVGLLMQSSNQYVLDENSTKTTYSVLDEDITIDSADLKRLFRIYTTTINMENRNQGLLL